MYRLFFFISAFSFFAHGKCIDNLSVFLNKEKPYELHLKKKILFLTQKDAPIYFFSELEKKKFEVHFLQKTSKKQLEKSVCEESPDFIVAPLSKEYQLEKIIKKYGSRKKVIQIFYPPKLSKSDLLLKKFTVSNNQRIKLTHCSLSLEQKLYEKNSNEETSYLIFKKSVRKKGLNPPFLNIKELPLRISQKSLENHLSIQKDPLYILIPQKKMLSIKEKKHVVALEKKIKKFMKKNTSKAVFLQSYRDEKLEPWNVYIEPHISFFLQKEKPLNSFKKQYFFIKGLD